MKSNKVLIGLIAGVLTLMGGGVKAQFHEVGPANIGGHISSIVVDRQDTSHGGTIYAGATTGGLYVMSTNPSVLEKLYTGLSDRSRAEQLSNDSQSWHLVRYIDETRQEMTLPISAMVQADNGTLFIGTGDDDYTIGSTYGKMSQKGRGIYRYNPEQVSFSVIPSSTGDNLDKFAAVHELGYFSKNGKQYLFAATSTGLYRWTFTSTTDESQWQSTPKQIVSGKVDQLLIIGNLNIAYFTIGNQLYRISDLTREDADLKAVNVSASNKAFGGTNTAIKLAVAPTDSRYLYAMVIDANGLMENVYLTTNGQTWTALATESVLPVLPFNDGRRCGALAVDPTNPKRIIVGGTNIWVGEGFLEGANYTWNKRSYSEYELNAGDYMSNVFTSPVFVHSGIQKIISHAITTGDFLHDEFLVATDAGIYRSEGAISYFANYGRGLNNVQINSVAVSPDGSVISGADFNASPFIEARLTHHGGTSSPAWYDDGELGNFNHDANILFSGNGGGVAASSFQQINTQAHRNIFVSSAGGNIARAWADYSDYTNTTTWTSGANFLTTDVVDGPQKTNLYLWENDNDAYMHDSISVTIDLHSYLIRANGDTINIDGDTNLRIEEGDRVTFVDHGNSDYPFEHTFTGKEVGKKVNSTFYVKNPVVSRLMAVANISASSSSVLFTWMPNDFTKIYDSVIRKDNALDAEVKSELMRKFMWWVPILTVNRNEILGTTNLYPRCVAMSPDGRFAYISTYDVETHRSQLYRVSGFENIDYTKYPTDIQANMNAASTATDRILVNTRFTYTSRGTRQEWFNRPISSIAVDPRSGADRIIITFEDYSSSGTNVAIINNASTDNWTLSDYGTTDYGIDMPVYSSLIEKTTGTIYIGTDNGVYYNNGTGWLPYEYLRGVPVTSIVQQTKEYGVRRAITHTGITENKYLFAKSKWPNAIYFGTYGRGIFLDMTYVTDTVNEISEKEDYDPVNIPTVEGQGASTIGIFPNPVSDRANLELAAATSGTATLVIYDLNGRIVESRSLGHVSEGNHIFTINTEGLSDGMYLINVIIGGHTAATKMVVR